MSAEQGTENGERRAESMSAEQGAESGERRAERMSAERRSERTMKPLYHLLPCEVSSFIFYPIPINGTDLLGGCPPPHPDVPATLWHPPDRSSSKPKETSFTMHLLLWKISSLPIFCTAMPSPCHPDQACRPHALSNRNARPGRRGEGSPVNGSWLLQRRAFPSCAEGCGNALRGGRAAHGGQDDRVVRWAGLEI